MNDPCLHTLQTDEMPPERLNCPYYYQPHPLCLKAAEEVQKIIAGHEDWTEEVGKGKMFGVLIVEGSKFKVQGSRLNLQPSTFNYLAAYSGQILGRSDWPGFVPAVFDYLQPEGYFKNEEHNIDNINVRVRVMEQSSELTMLRRRLREAEAEANNRLDAYRQMMVESKKERERQRQEGGGDPEALVRESQFQKAELKRMKAAVNTELLPLREALKNAEGEISALKQERKGRSDALQQWLFTNFEFLNGRGERRNLQDIFSDYFGGRKGVIPSGAGECCAPKLLQYAFENGYTPVAMAEFWWGESPKGEIRRHLDYYPACQGKCRPILDFMLEGIDVEPNPLEQQEETSELEIIYEDDYLIAINKPAGMLSVPGKGTRKSAQEILLNSLDSHLSTLDSHLSSLDSRLSPLDSHLHPIHRLDMQTSGVLLFAKTEVMQTEMRRMFEARKVEKTYYALLDGRLPDSKPTEGMINLPLAADYINRPRQKVDFAEGKKSETHYIIKGTRGGRTLLELHPKTGRTHQLRVHCAHPDGLGMPILGDDLYGRHAERLCLHAQKLEFEHPVTHKQIKIFADNLDF